MNYLLGLPLSAIPNCLLPKIREEGGTVTKQAQLGGEKGFVDLQKFGDLSTILRRFMILVLLQATSKVQDSATQFIVEEFLPKISHTSFLPIVQTVEKFPCPFRTRNIRLSYGNLHDLAFRFQVNVKNLLAGHITRGDNVVKPVAFSPVAIAATQEEICPVVRFLRVIFATPQVVDLIVHRRKVLAKIALPILVGMESFLHIFAVPRPSSGERCWGNGRFALLNHR